MRISKEEQGLTEDVVRIILTDSDGVDWMQKPIHRYDKEYVNLTLDDILKRCIKIDGDLRGIIVIAENPSNGRMFRYEPICDRWNLVGILMGYE